MTWAARRPAKETLTFFEISSSLINAIKGSEKEWTSNGPGLAF